MLSFSKNDKHPWCSKGKRHVLHFGHRYDPESKEVESHEQLPLQFLQALGLRAFKACAQVLPSLSLHPNMWSVGT